MPTQEETNEGQQKINGELCRVNWRVIEALRQIQGALPPNAALSRAIDEAEAIGARVAEIKPPGCIPENPKD